MVNPMSDHADNLLRLTLDTLRASLADDMSDDRRAYRVWLITMITEHLGGKDMSHAVIANIVKGKAKPWPI